MTVVVTGGAGFIGSHFLAYLRERYPEYRLVGLDKLTYAGNLAALRPIMGQEQVRFVQADICDRIAVERLFEEEHPDVVVNFAAESHVDRSIENPGLFLQTNVMGTALLLDACRKYGIRRFHQVSTDEVYGDLPLDRPDLLFTEEAPLRANSPYSASKAAADLLVQAYHRTYGLPVTISRCSNNYGPYQFPEKLVPLMILNALQDKPLPVYGTGQNVRDWLYVEDHCRALDLILHQGRDGEVYNVGGRNEMRNVDLVRLICKELGKPESLLAYVEDRKGHDLRYAVDSTKLQRELGWKPETEFADGIRSTIQWYVDHRSWWEPLVPAQAGGVFTPPQAACIADLHTHSTASDGQYTPSELVRLAKEKGLDVLALTDHDTTDGLDEAVRAGEALGVRVIRGIELSAKEYPTFHILGYGIDTAAPALSELCRSMKEGRDQRSLRIIDFLREKGVEISLAEVEALAGGKIVGRPHFAQVLVRHGYVSSNREAFDRFLDTEEFQRRIERPKPAARVCVETIKAAGGKVSLAHPYQIGVDDEALERIVRELAGYGLDAIECYYPKYTPEQQAFYLHLAEKYGLHISGGSDFHGERVKPDVQLAALKLDLAWLTAD